MMHQLRYILLAVILAFAVASASPIPHGELSHHHRQLYPAHICSEEPDMAQRAAQHHGDDPFPPHVGSIFRGSG
jgi:hypothetical protein